MDRVETMREKRTVPAVQLIKLIKIYASEENTVSCIFEGEDAKYYGVRIDNFLHGLERKNISCKGKEKLLRLKETVDSHIDLSKARILFFADRDFDFTHASISNLYITPCYSIENLYIKDIVLKKILTDEFGFCQIQEKDDLEHLIRIYQSLLSQLTSSLLLLNAWVYCQNEKRKVDETITLNLNNFSVEDFIEFDFYNVSAKYNQDSLNTFFPKLAPIPDSEIDVAKTLILEKDLTESLRGKFLLEFFRLFLEKVKVEINNGSSQIVKTTKKTKLTLSKSNIISDLSQYAVTPNCLIGFLKQNLEMST